MGTRMNYQKVNQRASMRQKSKDKSLDRYIKTHKVRQPTIKQLRYIKSICDRKGLPFPKIDTLREASWWIDRNK